MGKARRDHWSKIVSPRLELEREVERFLAAAASPDEKAQAERDAQAVELSAQLRQAGSVALARKVLATGGRRTSALRMEEALAAFALGDDDTLFELAREEPAVRAHLVPLVHAFLGKAPRLAGAMNPLERALVGLGKHVAAVVRGEVGKAKAALSDVPVALGAAALRGALPQRVGVGRGDQGSVLGLDVLLQDPLVRGDQEMERTVAGHVARHSPEVFLRRASDRRPFSADAWTFGQSVALASTAASAEPGRMVAIAAAVGADAFPEAARAAAALYEGFGLLGHSPERARKAFDRAIELGGDMIEALRGRVLCDRATSRCSGPAALRLARALARDPAGLAYGSAAALLAARAFSSAGDTGRVSEACGLARELAERAGCFHGPHRTDIELGLAAATLDQEEAEKMVDAVLAREPSDLEAWRQKIDLAEGYLSPEDVRLLREKAAAATQEDFFLHPGDEPWADEDEDYDDDEDSGLEEAMLSVLGLISGRDPDEIPGMLSDAEDAWPEVVEALRQGPSPESMQTILDLLGPKGSSQKKGGASRPGSKGAR